MHEPYSRHDSRESYDPYAAYFAPRRKPLWRRVWVWVLLALIILPAAAAGIYWLKIQDEYGAKAAQFDYSKLGEMESASTIYDCNNQILSRIFLENREVVPYDQFPFELIQSVVAAEDNKFFQHHGVDYSGMVRAAVKNWRAGRIRQGASTLTQQLARNSFPKELPSNDRSYSRKILECFVAQEIEKRLPKQKILELYLNRVYFGAGFYGAQAAARGYFGKDVNALTLTECAMMAGLLKNPNGLSPWSNRQACVEARNFVLGRMVELKMITPQQRDEAVATNLAVKNRRPFHSESYAIDMVRQQVNKLVGEGRAIADGYRIYTTIDGELQKKAEESLRTHLTEAEEHPGYEHQTFAQYDTLFKQQRKKNAAADSDEKETLAAPEYLQGALVALDNNDGAILALVGGRDFSQSQYDRAVSAARPSGTAFGPLVFAAAFEKGIFPGSLFQDAVIDNRQVMIGGFTGILGEWGPERADNRYEGPIPARQVLVKSKNAATVRVGMQTGIDNVIAVAKKAGLAHVAGKDEKGREVLNLRRYPATYLGSSEVTLMDMTLAYTMFPDLGTRPAEPFIIRRIEDRDGQTTFESHPERKRVIKDTTAYEVHSCLSEVLEYGTGDKAFSKYGLKKFPVAGKTGTAYNFTDDWFIGYSSAITCGVWAGFDKPQPIYRGAFSSDVILPVWVDVMNASFSKYPASEIPQPRGIKKYEVCLSSGQLATDKCEEIVKDKNSGETVTHRTTYFEIGTPEQAPKQTCTVHGEGAGQAIAAAQQIQQTPLNTPQTPSQYPRATLAVDLAKVTPIAIKAPTVVGEDDPYNSVKSSAALASAPAQSGIEPSGTASPANPGSAPAAANQSISPNPNSSTAQPQQSQAPKEPEVRRAVLPGALDQTEEDSTIKLAPPEPIQF